MAKQTTELRAAPSVEEVSRPNLRLVEPEVQKPVALQGPYSQERFRRDAEEELSEVRDALLTYRHANIDSRWNDAWQMKEGDEGFEPLYAYQGVIPTKEGYRQAEVSKALLANRLLPPGEKFQYQSDSDQDDDAASAQYIVDRQLSPWGYDEIRKWVTDPVDWGTSFLMYGWERKHVNSRVIDRVGERMDGSKAIHRKVRPVITERPYIKCVDPTRIITDPFCEQPSQSPYTAMIDMVSPRWVSEKVRIGEFAPSAPRLAEDDVGNGVGSRLLDNLQTGRLSDQAGRSWQSGLPRKLQPLALLTWWTNDGWEFKMIGDQIVSARPNPFGETPILSLKMDGKTGEMYGTPLLMSIKELLRVINDLTSMHIDNIHLLLNDMILMTEDVEDDFNQSDFAPGGQIVLPDIGEDKVRRLNLGNERIPEQIVAAIEYYRGLAKQATGVQDELQGITRQRSASGIQTLRDQAAIRTIEYRIQQYEAPFIQLFETLYNLNQQYLSETQSTRLIKRGRRVFRRHSGEVFQQPIRVRVLHGNQIEDPSVRQTKAMAKYAALSADPMVDKQKLLLDIERAEGSINPESILADPRKTESEIKEEFQEFLATGFTPPVRPTDDHEFILMVWQNFMATPAFLGDPTTGEGGLPPELRVDAQIFVEQHMAYVKEQQEAMAAQAQTSINEDQFVDRAEANSPVPAQEDRTEAKFNRAEQGAEVAQLA